MTTPASPGSVAVAPCPSDRSAARRPGLDALRGVAVLAMLIDHLCYTTVLPDWPRLSIGRLALPLFFIVAGAGYTSWRRHHWQLIALGLLLPTLVPWIDDPNVLLILGLAAALFHKQPRWLAPVVIAAALTALCNGYTPWLDTAHDVGLVTYELSGQLALFALGMMLGRDSFGWADRLAIRPVCWLGRHALEVYVLHVLALQFLLMWVATS